MLTFALNVRTFHFCYFNFLIAPLFFCEPSVFWCGLPSFSTSNTIFTPFFFFCKATLLLFFLRKCSNLLYLSYEVLTAPTLLPQKWTLNLFSFFFKAGFMKIWCSDLTTSIYLQSVWIEAVLWFFTCYSCLQFVTCSTVYFSKATEHQHLKDPRF